MFGNAFGWPHLIVILVVILLLFGAPKLPGLAKSLGQSMRIFRKEVSTMKEEKAADGQRSATSGEDAAGVDPTDPPAGSTATGGTAPDTQRSSHPKP